MQIICRKRLNFEDHEIVHNTKTDEDVAILKQSHIVSPSLVPQLVPDWIKDAELYRLSEEEGTITEVQVISVPKTKGKGGKTLEATPEKAQEPPASTGWGATPGAGLPNGNALGTGNRV